MKIKKEKKLRVDKTSKSSLFTKIKRNKSIGNFGPARV